MAAVMTNLAHSVKFEVFTKKLEIVADSAINIVTRTIGSTCRIG